MSSPTYFLEFTRICSQRTNDTTINGQLNYILDRGMSGGRGKGWTKQIVPDEPTRESVDGVTMWKFRRTVRLIKSSGRAESAHDQFQAMLEVFEKTLPQPQAGGIKYPWTFVVPNQGAPPTKITSTPIAPPVNVPVKYKDINLNRGKFFDHIYDRDAQIEIILSAIYAAVESEMDNRYHCVLWGEPACGKSDTLISVGKMLGEENQAYFKFDATSMTEAGVKKFLLDSADMGAVPPVLVIEEIEKTEDKMLRWLLGVMDTRGEIRQLNFRVGNRQANVPMLCLATVNDIVKFREVMSGALASRFSHEVYFPRPSREILKRILKREIDKLPDIPENTRKEEWIEPTLRFCVDNPPHINDPRKIIPICICGKDKLLTGEYQDWVRRSRKEFYDTKPSSG